MTVIGFEGKQLIGANGAEGVCEWSDDNGAHVRGFPLQMLERVAINSEVARASDWETLSRLWDEFARTKTLPDLQDQLADVRWFIWRRDDLQVQNHRGDYVAILNGQVVGVGTNPMQLGLDVAKHFDVHPSRVVVEWVDDGRDVHITLPDDQKQLPGGGTDACSTNDGSLSNPA